MSLFQAESEGEGTKKEHLGIVIVGHVDAGKSTTTGHLLFKLGGMTERELEKLRQEASAQGKDMEGGDRKKHKTLSVIIPPPPSVTSS